MPPARVTNKLQRAPLPLRPRERRTPKPSPGNAAPAAFHFMKRGMVAPRLS
jgi:hypothetical protein